MTKEELKGIPATLEDRIADYMTAAYALINDLDDLANANNYHVGSYVSYRILDPVENGYGAIKELNRLFNEDEI